MNIEERRTEWQEVRRYCYQRAKRLHKCCNCGADTEPKPNGGYYVQCAVCRAKDSAQKGQIRKKCMAEHKCIVCGAVVTAICPRTGNYYPRCPTCTKRCYESQKEYRERRKRRVNK